MIIINLLRYLQLIYQLPCTALNNLQKLVDCELINNCSQFSFRALEILPDLIMKRRNTLR